MARYADSIELRRGPSTSHKWLRAGCFTRHHTNMRSVGRGLGLAYDFRGRLARTSKGWRQQLSRQLLVQQEWAPI